jgi:hypothetical protein
LRRAATSWYWTRLIIEGHAADTSMYGIVPRALRHHQHSTNTHLSVIVLVSSFMKVDKQKFDAVLGALLKAPPAPLESFKGKHAKKAPPQVAPQKRGKK